ncbi:hypothetical protein D3C87_1617570 [compost metagenome]
MTPQSNSPHRALCQRDTLAIAIGFSGNSKHGGRTFRRNSKVVSNSMETDSTVKRPFERSAWISFTSSGVLTKPIIIILAIVQIIVVFPIRREPYPIFSPPHLTSNSSNVKKSPTLLFDRTNKLNTSTNH